MPKVFKTSLAGVFELSQTVLCDHSGYCLESFNQAEFNVGVGCDVSFVQDNEAYSKQNVLRGLHYQLVPQGKLIRVLQGDIFDVVVDLRKSSATFGRWFGIVLSQQKKNQLWIPAGFAHGFLSLTNSVVLYKTTAYHCVDGECIIRWDDEDLDIHWPLERPPIFSGRDTQGSRFKDCVVFD
jgi:dTDP-4-dehydrorhamnose 3,5-epimerase